MINKGVKVAGAEAALMRARAAMQEGADILDIGGQSTRPGAQRLGPSEELDRILPAIRRLPHSP